MRKCSKFKYINTRFIYSFFFFKRILKFKRPKWKRIKTRLFFFRRQFFFAFKLIKRRKFYLKKKFKLTVFLNFKKKIKFFKILPKIFLNLFYILKLKLALKTLKFLKRKVFRITKNFFWLRRKQKLFLRFKQLKNSARVVSYSFFSFIHVRLPKPFLKRSKYFFKDRLHMKFWVFKYFSMIYSLHNFKKIFKQYSNSQRLFNFSLLFIKLDTRLDLLLYRVSFFISPYLARFAIRNALVMFFKNSKSFVFQKNNEKLYPIKNTVVKMLYSPFYLFKQIKKHFAPSFYLPSFIEIDYYLQQVIILKNFNELFLYDLTNSVREPLSFYKFKNFILK